MINNFDSKDVKSELKDLICKSAIQYGSAYVKCAVIKNKDELYLYLADIKIQHRDDEPIAETIHEYENVIFATLSLTIQELETVIEEIDSGKINLKSLKEINVKNAFNQNYYHIPSRMQYAGYYYEWPSHCFRVSLGGDVIINDVSSPLIRLGLPSHTTFYDACDVFFQHEQYPNQHTAICINFLIPNYDARIETLEIADKRISIKVESKGVALNDLTVQIGCKKSNHESQNSGDLKPDARGMVVFPADFVPSDVFVCLLNSKTGKTIDLKIHPTNFRTEGIVIKTSSENLNVMISEGENQQVEFKRGFDKTNHEFLESVVAFANTNDGTILLGVDDEGIVVGFFDDFGKTKAKIRGLVNGNCESYIKMNIEPVFYGDKPVIVIKVSEGKDKPYLLAGKSAYLRVDASDCVFKRLDFDKIYNEKKNRNADPFIHTRKYVL